MTAGRATSGHEPTSGRLKSLVVWAMLVCVVLSGVATTTMLRIEMLNAEVGDILPRSKRFGGQHPTKWRLVTLRLMRRSLETEFRGMYSNRPLTPEETAEIETDLAHCERKNELRQLVASWGLMQYLIAPLGLALSALGCVLVRGMPARIGFAACCVCSSVAVAMMNYREYWTSLGP